MTNSKAFRVADLSQNSPTPFELRPDPAWLRALAEELDVIDLRKVVFSGTIAGQGRRDWVLKAKLGATVVQPCVVTLEPVTTRIDTDVRRTYLAEMPEIDAEEVEMPEDDTQEQLGTVIDPAQVMAEALALALPLYPRKDGAEVGTMSVAAPGIAPLSDDDVKPFAGLASLRDKLQDKD